MIISYSSSCCDEIHACLNLGRKGLFGLQLYHTLHLEGGDQDSRSLKQLVTLHPCLGDGATHRQ